MSDSISSAGGADPSAALSQIDVLVALKARNAAQAQGQAALQLMAKAAQIAQGGGGVSADGHVDLLA